MATTRTRKSTNALVAQSGKTVKTDKPDEVFINVPLPTDIHRRLRIRCVERDLGLKEAVQAAVEAWLA